MDKLNFFNSNFTFKRKSKNNFRKNISLLIIFSFIIMIICAGTYLRISRQIKSQIKVNDFQNFGAVKTKINSFIDDIYIPLSSSISINDMSLNKCKYKFMIINDTNEDNNTNEVEVAVEYSLEKISDQEYIKYKLSEVDIEKFKIINKNQLIYKYGYTLYPNCELLSDDKKEKDQYVYIKNTYDSNYESTTFEEFKPIKLNTNEYLNLHYTYKPYFIKDINAIIQYSYPYSFNELIKLKCPIKKNHFLAESELAFTPVNFKFNFKDQPKNLTKKPLLKVEYSIISSGDLYLNIYYELLDILPILFIIFALIVIIIRVIFSQIDIYGNNIFLINSFFKMSILKKDNFESIFSNLNNKENKENFEERQEDEDENFNNLSQSKEENNKDFAIVINSNYNNQNNINSSIHDDICQKSNEKNINFENKNSDKTISSDLFCFENIVNKGKRLRNSLKLKFNNKEINLNRSFSDTLLKSKNSNTTINTNTKTDTSLKIIKEDRRNSNLIPFQFKWLDIFKFILPFKNTSTKNKKKLFFSLVEQIDYFMNPSFYLKLCSLTENKVNQLDFTSIYSVLITNDYQNFTINRNMTIYNIINNSKS